MKIEIDFEKYPLYKAALERLAAAEEKPIEEVAENLLFTKLIEEHNKRFGSWV